MKVLVLNPPVSDVRFSRDGRCQSEENTWLDTFPPTTLASIAGAVRTKYETKLLDCIGAKITLPQCIREVGDYRPDYTVVNTSTPTIQQDLNTAAEVKKASESKIILYGEHATARYKQILESHPQVDYVALSEPETPVMKILEGDVESPGVASRKWDGGLWQEPDLDRLPFPAYDLLPEYSFPLTGEKWMFIRSGRGCPANCTYCVIPHLTARKVRYHSPEYMIRQIKWLASDLGIRLYMFWDELATFDRGRMIRLCDMMVKEGLNKKCRWFCTTRVDRFDVDLGGRMHEAGCRMISFGIESGSQKVLDLNCKGTTLEQSRKAVKAARDNHIKTIGHFIVGLPGSDEKTSEETARFARELKLDFAQFYTATPFPGSRLYEMARENGWLEGEDWGRVEQGSVVLNYPDFPAERIEYWRRKAYRDFYMRPQAAYSVLSMMSLGQMIKLPFMALNFLKWMRK